MNGETVNLVYSIKITLEETTDEEAIENYSTAINLLTRHMVNKNNFTFPQNIPDFIKFINTQPINSYIDETLNDKPFLYNGSINEDILKEINEENPDEKVQKYIYEMLLIAREKAKEDFDYWYKAYLNMRTFMCSNYCISKRDFDITLSKNQFPKEFIPYLKMIYINAKEISGDLLVCPVCGKPVSNYDRSEGECSSTCNYYISLNNDVMRSKSFNEKMLKVHNGIYNYILLPGIAENLIFQKLKDYFKDFEVVLYPNIDRYDISVSNGIKTVNLDVKDTSDPSNLVKILKEKSDISKFKVDKLEKTLLVIPNHRVKIFKRNENRRYIKELEAILGNENLNIKVIQEKNLIKVIEEWLGDDYE